MTAVALSEAQADGRACVACEAEDGPMVPVGHVRRGGPVFACVGCVERARVLIGGLREDERHD